MHHDSFPISHYTNRSAISAAVSARIATAAREAVARSGRFTLAIAPAVLDADIVHALHIALPDAKAWEHTHVFWVDTDFGAHEGSPAQALALIRSLPIPRRNVHLDVADEANAIRAACNYEQMLRGFFGTDMSGVPSFDLIVTTLESAQAFAKMRQPASCDRLAVAAFDPVRTRHTVTLTPPVIGSARALLMVASGAVTEIEPIALAARVEAVRECLTCVDPSAPSDPYERPTDSFPATQSIETRVIP